MVGLIRKIKLKLSATAAALLLNYKQSNIVSIWPGALLVSIIFATKGTPCSIFIIICLSLGIYFELFSTIYCDSSNAAAATVDENDTDIDNDFDIPSILEYGDIISPLHSILNNEIAMLLLILVHMAIIAMVLFNKFYVSRSSYRKNLISKLFSKSLVKFEKYKPIIDKLGNRYLNLLLVINVTFIIVYILILLYVNIKLSSNLDDFIDVHIEMKKGIILFINSKFLFCLDNKHRNRWYNLNYYLISYYYSKLNLVGYCLKPRLAAAFGNLWL